MPEFVSKTNPNVMDGLRPMVKGYLLAAEWADLPDEWREIVAHQSTRMIMWEKETVEAANRDCKAFSDMAHRNNLAPSNDHEAESWGHCLWLSRNGHGTGFFDLDDVTAEAQQALQILARGMGEMHVEVVSWRDEILTLSIA